MPELTPIQTEYNGHHFRSRLEARWAVFFDALGVRYEYEAEGYDLNGVWYLPDFWLPDVGCYVEIKPQIGPDDVGLIGSCATLAETSGRAVLAVYGNPWPGDYQVALHARRHFIFGGMSFAPGTKHLGELWLWGDYGVFCLSNHDTEYDYPDHQGDLLGGAYRAARSARFEHGESGRTL